MIYADVITVNGRVRYETDEIEPEEECERCRCEKEGNHGFAEGSGENIQSTARKVRPHLPGERYAIRRGRLFLVA